MVLRTLERCPLGEPFSSVVQVLNRNGKWIIGSELWSGQRVAFQYEGCMDSYMTLYQVVKTDDVFQDAQVVLLDPLDPPISSRVPQKHDFGYAHDVCCGLGGFATALDFLGCQVVSAADWSSHAMETYVLNHDAMILRAAIGDVATVYKRHCAQKMKDVQPMPVAGYPCQPFSDQGNQLGGLDVRSRTLRSVLPGCCPKVDRAKRTRQSDDSWKRHAFRVSSGDRRHGLW